MKSWPLIITAILAQLHVNAQEFRFHQYRVVDGLPSDLTKGIAEDSLGFIWVCTDDGLVRFDGATLTPYKTPLVNQYTKGFLKTKKGKLLIFGDQDLLEIHSQPDSVVFKRLATGTHNPTDSSLWYPKSLYEDVNENLWMGEPQAILRMTNGKLRRYSFGIENRSPVFIRSFSFFENGEGQLFASSYSGSVFRYEPQLDEFLPLSDLRFPNQVSATLVVNGKLWIATEEGLFETEFKGNSLTKPKQRLDTRLASSLLAVDSHLWVGTYTGRIIQLDLNSGRSSEVLFAFDGIINMYKSTQEDFWVATDKGLFLVQQALFSEVNSSSRGTFVEALAEDESRSALYYSIKEDLYEVIQKDGNWQTSLVYRNNMGYFQSLVFGGRNLWAANAFSLLLFRNNQLFRTWDLTHEGQFIHDLWLASDNKLWLCQDGTDSVSVFDGDLTRKKYRVPVKNGSTINVVREGAGGMYAAASEKDAYLFFKAHDSNSFENISVPVQFSQQSDLNIVDMVPHNNVLWLASSEGLLRYDGKTVERTDLGDRFTSLPVKVVEVLDSSYILFGNAFGVFQYHVGTGEYWLYDENSGLPSNTVNARGIFLDHEKRLWIGTSNGVVFARKSLLDKKETPQPYCVEQKVNGEDIRPSRELSVPYHAFLTFTFTSPVFPQQMIHMEWRFSEGDTTWRSMDESEINLVELSSGEYTVEARAKKTMGYNWSEPLLINIHVGKPVWSTWWFIAIIFIIVAFIAWVSITIAQQIQKTRKRMLENQVRERTHELRVRNEELDRFVYSASHDLSAPLKSILGLIAVARMEKPTPNHLGYLDMMEQSVRKLDHFIKEVVDYSRNVRMPVKKEIILFKSFVESILEDHRFTPGFDKIKFIIEDSSTQQVILDSMRLKIVLNNLLSNAIKFHLLDGSRQPTVRLTLLEDVKQLKIIVQDNGKGIAPQHLEHIFSMFYRATDSAAGSGLGLYILKESINKMGGTVKVESAVDVGTTFTIVLPN